MEDNNCGASKSVMLHCLHISFIFFLFVFWINLLGQRNLLLEEKKKKVLLLEWMPMTENVNFHIPGVFHAHWFL